MPKNKVLRAEIIQLHYDVPVAEHRGKQKTTELVTRNYQQPEVTKDVEECDMYQRMKNRTEVLVGKLKLSEISAKPQTHLIVDFIMKLPIIARKNMILVVYDKLSKMTHFVTTTEETSAKGLARLCRDDMWKLHGLSKSIVLDRGPQFAAKMTRELNRMLEIEMRLLTLFHLQTDS